MYNGILIVDKPAGMTSHTVVNRLRTILHQKKIGHGGTLDPMATGVLPMLTGRATRAAEYIQGGDKTYLARFQLGVSTDTQDITGTVLRKLPVAAGPAEVENVLARFLGQTRQVPPMYSAVQVDGTRLYRLARQGVEIEREARDITVSELRLTGSHPETDEYELRVTCSKGTYIRTLCADIGDALGCGAAVTALRRVQTGLFSIEQAYTLTRLSDAAENGSLPSLFLPVDLLFRGLPELRVGEQEEERLRRGAPVYLHGAHAGRYRVYGARGEFFGPGLVEETDRSPVLTLEKGFFELRDC